jgi:uncharacterized protein (TIGR00299 family) protein
MKIAYLECQTGIAGDMCLGALVDAGVPLAYLNEQLARLGIQSEYELRAEKLCHNGQIATKVDVYLHPSSADRAGAPELATTHTSGGMVIDESHHHTHDHHHHLHERVTGEHQHSSLYDTPQRNLPQIVELINGANLPSKAAQWSLEVFRQLAIAEGAVHGIEPNEVHFHEVGAVDAIVDIVGTCLGLDYLEIDRVYCSPLPTGGGVVRAAHGLLPVPVPAVIKLWESRRVPVYSNGIDRELVTPTGAALAVTLATDFGAAPAMNLEKIGLGAGTIALKIPNILRLWIGTANSRAEESAVETRSVDPQYLESIYVLETQIDDLNPQAIGYVFEALFQAGAVDVFTQAIGMKKSRPGILLTVICHSDRMLECEQIIFQETTTIGIRRSQQMRSTLPREIQTISTQYGEERVKIAKNNLIDDSRIMNIQPEYADCARLAQTHQVSWLTVYRSALGCYADNS